MGHESQETPFGVGLLDETGRMPNYSERGAATASFRIQIRRHLQVPDKDLSEEI